MRISLLTSLALLPLAACSLPSKDGADPSETGSGTQVDDTSSEGDVDTAADPDTAADSDTSGADTGAEDSSAEGTAPATLAELFAQLGPPSSTFSVNASEGGVVVGDGVTLVFGPDAFVDASGAVATGEVMVSLTEYRTVGDMVRGGRPTITTDGAWLETSGSFDLSASQEGEDVVITDVQSMTFDDWDGGSPDAAMELWVTEQEGDAWVRPLPAQPIVGRPVDSADGMATMFMTNYLAGIGSYPSFNCDAISYLSSTYSTLTVQFLSHFTTDSGVFFLPDGYNSAVRLYDGDATIPGYFSYNNSMPVGITGKLIVFSLIDGDYYLYHDDAYTIAAGTDNGSGVMEVVLPVDPVLVTEAEFEAYIGSL